MPELPDVEVFKQYFDATSLHQKIEKVEIGDKQILRNTSPSKLAKALSGHSFSFTNRHGKYLFAHLDDHVALTLHFGMTGFLKYFKDMEKDPPHDRLMITFANGFHLAYDSQRKFGEVSLVEDQDDFLDEKKLGPDALNIPFPDFRNALKKSRATVKAALMNQKILAGIGNVYSDEILFQARIYPEKKAKTLDEETLKNLFKAKGEVLNKAIESRADPEEFPKSFLTPHRHDDRKCPRCKNDLESDKIAGRTAYYCPKCQKR